jgi:AraC-like DNA-binding protein
MSQEQAEEECHSLIATLAAAIGAQADRRSLTRAHLRRNQFSAICRWIDDNLADTALEPAAFTRKFWITRPTLYRMFEQRGGIMKYIQQRRLEKVFQDLVDPSLQHVRIGEIMNRWGLHEQTVAGRAFRAYFGLTPRQVRANIPATMHHPPVASTEMFRIQNMERLGPLLEQHNRNLSQHAGEARSAERDTSGV